MDAQEEGSLRETWESLRDPLGSHLRHRGGLGQLGGLEGAPSADSGRMAPPGPPRGRPRAHLGHPVEGQWEGPVVVQHVHAPIPRPMLTPLGFTLTRGG